MPEEEKIEETVEETVEEKVEETKEEEKEDKSSLVQGLLDKVLGKKEEVEEEETEPEIPEEFLAVAEGQFSEEEIKKLASEHTPEELKKLVPFLLDEEEDTEEETEGTETKEELVEVDEENLKPYIEKLQAALDAKYLERIDALEKSLQSVNDERVVKEEQHRQETADTFFDKASKQLPVFGETKKLMRFPDSHRLAGQIIPIGSAYDARQAVWTKANQFTQLGASWSDSLDDALAWYKGKHGEKELKQQMIKDLKSNEKRLSPKRSTTDTEKTYATPYEEKLAVIEEAKKKAGIV